MSAPSDVAPEVLPFGTWPSPITARSLVDGVVTPSELVVDGEDVWWSENRPSEGGRVALMRWRAGTVEEMTPPDVNVRSRVHEYGGGAWWVADGVAYYSDFVDGRLQRLVPGAPPEPLTPAPARPNAMRYADGRVDPGGRWFVCVRETHPDAANEDEHAPGSAAEAVNDIVAVATDGSHEVRVLVTGMDFYAAPRPSPDGRQLAWLQWAHPAMPWDGCELWLGRLEDGTVVSGRPIAGSSAGGWGEAISQPEWSPAGDLWFCSDRSGWSNLYRYADGAVVAEIGGEFEIGQPHWLFGEARFAIAPDDRVAAALRRPSGDVLLVDADPAAADIEAQASILRDWSEINSVRLTRSGRVVVLAGSHRVPAVVAVAAPEVQLLSEPPIHGVAPAFLPAPEAITFPSGPVGGPPSNGMEQGDAVAHALFYRPAHATVRGPEHARPPLLVLVHGGPTSQARRVLSLALRFWTSRGWAVVDVDYRGSSGYGREYRDALRGQWGIADVEDCVHAARFLAERGDVDPDRLVIRGGSAGGFTVLAALTGHEVFAAGVSRYGVADLETLARDTHKFESRYLDGLVAPYPAGREVYRQRSPIHRFEDLAVPLIVLQGADDEVVPPAQAELMVAALRAKGIEHEYHLYEGEGHGFRRADTQIAALEAEEAFLRRVLTLG